MTESRRGWNRMGCSTLLCMLIETQRHKILSRVRGSRDKNKRGFSGFNEGVYLNPLRLHTTDVTHTFAFDGTQTRVF
jgi:hypothetical protein